MAVIPIIPWYLFGEREKEAQELTVLLNEIRNLRKQLYKITPGYLCLKCTRRNQSQWCNICKYNQKNYV